MSIQTCSPSSRADKPFLLEDSFHPPVEHPSTIFEGVPEERSCGSKHDALCKVRDVMRGASFSVPLFFGFTHEEIEKYLSLETKQVWQSVALLGKDMLRSNEMEELLKKLQEHLKDDIQNGDELLSEDMRVTLFDHAKSRMIVRSSSNEDTKVTTNAGGNLSVAGIEGKEGELKKAVAQVVASYFGIQSLRNRASFEDPFQKFPCLSVLVMEQITDENDDDPVASGVMMTHKPTWLPEEEGRMTHIVASWGFGEGVVSGKVPCDEWILHEDESYETIRKKPFRIRSENGGVQKEVPNDVSLQEKPALSKEMIHELKDAAQKLEDYFQQPLDVEFVVKSGKLFIVQARPIQAPTIETPTFIDRERMGDLSPYYRCFTCQTVVSGASQALSLTQGNILCAKDLDKAISEFDPSIHKAVVVYTAPQGANTHAEVNFLSQRPPIPCFFLPYDEWKEFKCENERDFSSMKAILACPQTGLLVFGGHDSWIRQGLFLHPNHACLSVSPHDEGIRGFSTHPTIKKIKKLLTATGEELFARLPAISKEMTLLFSELAERPTSSHVKDVALRLEEIVKRVFTLMEEAAKKKRPTLLSFHAKVLGSLLDHSEKGVVGGDTLSGLEATTLVSEKTAHFMKAYQHDDVLVELGRFANKAFDTTIENTWLTFLENEAQKTQKKDLSSFLIWMKELDAMGLITLWLSVYFSSSKASLENLLEEANEMKEVSRLCLHFEEKFHHLADRVEKLSNEREMHDTWKDLKEQSYAFLEFCSKHTTLSLFSCLQVSKLFYDLLQLWDLSIKTVSSSRILQSDHTSQEFGKRVSEFAAFGLSAMNRKNGLVFLNPTILKDLKYVLEGMKSEVSWSRKDNPFSVQQWIIPLAPSRNQPQNDDDRLSVIHQNLLKASGIDYSPQVKKLLPSALLRAVEIFQEKNPTIVKRFADCVGTFVSICDECMSVTINVPLNYHSFVVTIKQMKGSDEVEFDAYWRGSDNYQNKHLSFFQIFSLLSHIPIKSHNTVGSNFRAVFSVSDENKMKLLSKAIFEANFGSLHGNDDLSQLIAIFHLTTCKAEIEEEFLKETDETRKHIIDSVMNLFVETGIMPSWWQSAFKYSGEPECWIKYREKILDRVREEQTGKKNETGFSEVFFECFLELCSLEEQKELIWENLTHSQTVHSYMIPESLREELKNRLEKEVPEKFESCCCF